jgi:hypothetical protein
LIHQTKTSASAAAASAIAAAEHDHSAPAAHPAAVWVTICVTLIPQQAVGAPAALAAAATRKSTAENPTFHALVTTLKALLREQGIIIYMVIVVLY